MKNALIMTFAFLLFFCGSQPFVYGENKKVDKTASPEDGIKIPHTYEYRPKGRRDPFDSLIIAEPEVVDKVVRKKSAPPLESYDVSNFKLIATLWNKVGNYAVITLPHGKSYTIIEGVRLGLYNGKVHKITRDSVIIRESIKDHKGIFRAKDTILKLRREEEG